MATVASPFLGIMRLCCKVGEVKPDICFRVQEADGCDMKLSSFLGQRPSSSAEKILVVGLVLLCLCNLLARPVCHKPGFSPDAASDCDQIRRLPIQIGVSEAWTASPSPYVNG